MSTSFGDTSALHVATPTSSPAPTRTPTHSVAMPTPLLQAVYDRNSQQPLYILQSGNGPTLLQSGNGPTLIPVQGLQGIQMATPPQRGSAQNNPPIHIPTSLNLDQLAGKGWSSLTTPPPATPTTLDGLVSPSPLLMPQSNGGLQLSEAGPIRTIARQAAKERPSPVAMDGEWLGWG